MPNVTALFREYAYLDKKRTADGLTPVELQRWQLLKNQLNRQLSPGLPPNKLDRRESVRLNTKIKVAFKTANEFEKARMLNFSRGGVFVNTPFPPAIGTQLILRVEIETSGVQIEIPGEVVSTNFTGAASTALGMGVKFLPCDEKTQKLLNQLYGEELDRLSDDN